MCDSRTPHSPIDSTINSSSASKLARFQTTSRVPQFQGRRSMPWTLKIRNYTYSGTNLASKASSTTYTSTYAPTVSPLSSMPTKYCARKYTMCKKMRSWSKPCWIMRGLLKLSHARCRRSILLRMIRGRYARRPSSWSIKRTSFTILFWPQVLTAVVRPLLMISKDLIRQWQPALPISRPDSFSTNPRTMISWGMNFSKSLLAAKNPKVGTMAERSPTFLRPQPGILSYKTRLPKSKLKPQLTRQPRLHQ